MDFGDFELFDEEKQTGPTKREARLEAARQASKNYKAKLDEPDVCCLDSPLRML